jgi:isoleucyl-tRNA synthetase
LVYRHPFANRMGRVVLADYVTMEDGTGLVHTAPGHGEDDYQTGVREKLDVYSPVLADGKFDETAPAWLVGKKVWEANPLITDRLKTAGLLFSERKISHSYPHDWRSKKPIIFRATEQWFIDVGKPYSGGGSLRERALACVQGDVDFVPKWGQARFAGMLQSRPDWCVSRQRAWGLPIPVFYNEKGDALLTADSVRAVARRFAEREARPGSRIHQRNYWAILIRVRTFRRKSCARRRIFSMSGSNRAVRGMRCCRRDRA